MSLIKKIELRDGEKIVEVVKPSPLKFFWHYFLAAAILFALSFFLFWLVQQNIFGILVIGSCFAASVALFWDARRRRNANYWILTTERLIDVEKNGLLSETVSPVDYSSITDVHIRKRGMNALLFGLGDLVADTENEDYAVSISCVRHPQIVLEWILQLSQHSDEKKDFNDARVVLKFFYKIIPRLTSADLNEIRNRIDNRESGDDDVF